MVVHTILRVRTNNQTTRVSTVIRVMIPIRAYQNHEVLAVTESVLFLDENQNLDANFRYLVCC